LPFVDGGDDILKAWVRVVGRSDCFSKGAQIVLYSKT